MAAADLTREQKIAQLQQAGILPPDPGISPAAAGGGTELTRAQKIQALTKAGVATPPAPAESPGLMDRNLNPLSGVPFMGGDVSANDMVHGAINDLPVVGGIVGGAIGGGMGLSGGLGTGGAASVPLAIAGGMAGAKAGGMLGSAAKDALDYMIYGKQKPLMDAARDANQQGQNMAVAAGLGEGIPAALGVGAKALLATKAGSNAGALVSGVAPQLIKAYADGAQRIKAAFSSADEGTATFRMAQAAKVQYGQDLIATRSALNDVIGKGIEDSSAVVSSQPIIDNLKASSAKLNPKLDGPQIDQIQELIDRVKAVSFNDGSMPVQAAQQLKVHFQGLADSAYAMPGTSNVASTVANAAKGAAATTRLSMEPVIPKAVAAANKQLSTLHTIEDSMNKALLNPRSSAKALTDAGTAETAAGSKNLADLQDMQSITRTNMVQPAQDVAAAQALGKYKFSPSIKGLGQPMLKGAMDLSEGTGAVGQTLGQAVMHGADAMNSLQTPGQPQQ